MFILFGGDNYYPYGGAQDFIKKFTSLEEAHAWCQQNIVEEDEVTAEYTDMNIIYRCGDRDYDWIHIFDVENEQMTLPPKN